MGLPLDVHGLRIAFPGTLLPDVVTIPGMHLRSGDAVGLEGPSGSGKTSLLHVLAGIDRPAAGRVCWGDADLVGMPGHAADAWRRRHAGLVFQELHLIEGMSALANVLAPVWFDHMRIPAGLRERALELLEAMRLADPSRCVEVMSRGERQRVALARALLRRPGVLLADEPTASLDQVAAAEVTGLLLAAAREAGATLIVASHDPMLLEQLPLRWRIAEGRLVPS